MFSAGDLEAVVVQLGELVAVCEPGQLTGAEADAVLVVSAAAKRYLTSIETMVAPRVQEAKVFQRAGVRTAAEYVAGRTGTTVAEAKGLLAAGQRLGDQPELEAAVKSGRLSSVQLREVSEAVADAPGAAGRLLEVAGRESFKGLRDECRRERAVGRNVDELHARAHQRRRVSHGVNPDLSFWLQYSGTNDAGQELLGHVDPFIRGAFDLARQEGRREPVAAYAADGFLAMARFATQVITGQQIGPHLYGPDTPTPTF